MLEKKCNDRCDNSLVFPSLDFAHQPSSVIKILVCSFMFLLFSLWLVFSSICIQLFQLYHKILNIGFGEHTSKYSVFHHSWYQLETKQQSWWFYCCHPKHSEAVWSEQSLDMAPTLSFYPWTSQPRLRSHYPGLKGICWCWLLLWVCHQ